MKLDKMEVVTGVVGAGMVLLGGVLYWRAKRGARLAVPGTGDLGRVRMQQAPIVGGYSDGNMKTTLRASRDMPIQERIATIQDLIHKSMQDPEMRKVALTATRGCPERDQKCEAQAIYQFVKSRVRYTGDVGPIIHPDGNVEGVDLYQSARRTLEFGGGDCLPIDTLVLRDDYALVPLSTLDPGDRIMGDGAWTTVQERWLTGEKELLEFELSNGCVLRCTPEHRIFRDVAGRLEEIRAIEACIGDDLVTAQSIPTAGDDGQAWPASVGALTPEERGWLLGVFVADGWADGKHTQAGWSAYRVGISGADGKPKEEQKRRVEELMAKAGVATRWHNKYIAINDPALAKMFAESGKGAVNKHLVSLQTLDVEQTRAIVEGLAADADRRSGVFGSTSPSLTLQLRVLYRMLGQSVHIRRVDDHGGLGKHAVYRITPRAIDNDRRDIRFARIRGIRHGEPSMCMDLTTDTGKFWLPESDVLVHNCDDQAILNSTLLALNGLEPRLRVVRQKKDPDWSHIYAGAIINGKFVALDTTLPGNRSFNYETPIAKMIEFPA